MGKLIKYFNKVKADKLRPYTLLTDKVLDEFLEDLHKARIKDLGNGLYQMGDGRCVRKL